MEISVKHVDNVCVVAVEGTLNVYTAHELRDTIYAAIEMKATACILNLKKATHVDSSGLGTLISLNAMLVRNGLSFCIVGVPRHIMQLLELTQTITILRTENTVLAALCALGMVPHQEESLQRVS